MESIRNIYNRSSKAKVMRGNSTVASPSIVTYLAFSPILPHETASRNLAPDKLPSHSGAVVMYTAKSKPSLNWFHHIV